MKNIKKSPTGGPKEIALQDFSKNTIEEEILDYLSDSDISHSSKDKGTAFTKFYIENYISKNYTLDEDDVADGLEIDGANDCGVDFIYEADKVNIIIQCKYRSPDSESTINKGDLSAFKDTYQNLFKSSTAEQANMNLKYYLENIRKNKKTKPIYMQFVYNKRFTSSQKKYIKDFKSEIEQIARDNNYPMPEIKFIDLISLKEDWDRMHKSKSQGISTVIPIYDFNDKILELRKNKPIPSPMWFDMEQFSKDGKGAIVFPISAATLLNIYNDFGDSLFSENIRLYQGSGKIVNKGILNTIKNSPEKFFIYNNGISGICTSYEVSRHNVNVFGLQIINGAQTVMSIREAQLNSYNFSDVYVLIKLTITKDDETKRTITQTSNSQTSIVPADFRANDPIQLFLNEKIKQYSYYGKESKPCPKELFYINKRQDLKSLKKFATIDLPNLAKVLAAIKLGPNVSSATSSLFNTDGNYWKIFGDEGYPLDVWDTKRLKETAAIICLWKQIEFIRKKDLKEFKDKYPEKIETPVHLARLPRFHILYSYYYLLELHYQDDMKKIFDKILSGNVFNQSNNFIQSWYENIVYTIANVLKQTPGVNFRNWQRTKSTIKNLNIALNDEPKSRFEISNDLLS